MSKTNGTTTMNGHSRNGAPALPVADGSNGQPATEGRGAGGRFAPGNKHGRGNPHARRMAELRAAFLSVATPEGLRQLGETMLKAALGGDWVAAKLLLSYVIGKPEAGISPDRLDLDEWHLLNASPTRAEVALALLDLVPADVTVATLAEWILRLGGSKEKLHERVLEKSGLSNPEVAQVRKDRAASRRRS